MNDGRDANLELNLSSVGFELRSGCTSSVQNFRDDDEVQRVYYGEIEQIVRKAFQDNHPVKEDEIENVY